MTKSWGPSWGKQLPGERPRETAETRHTSPQPSRHVRKKGAALLSDAKERTARAIRGYARCVCLLSLQMGTEWTLSSSLVLADLKASVETCRGPLNDL
jgi:hypothetical protein